MSHMIISGTTPLINHKRNQAQQLSYSTQLYEGTKGGGGGRLLFIINQTPRHLINYKLIIILFTIRRRAVTSHMAHSET